MPAGFDPSQFAQAQGGAAAASSSGGPGVKIEEVD
jgi:hypothetical protein